jgi:hypothetical protein
VEQSRNLLSRSTNGSSTLQPPSTAPGALTPSSQSETEEDQACLRLYEDLTGLNITGCKVKVMAKGHKEHTFNCVQTHEGRSG